MQSTHSCALKLKAMCVWNEIEGRRQFKSSGNWDQRNIFQSDALINMKPLILLYGFSALFSQYHSTNLNKLEYNSN